MADFKRKNSKCAKFPDLFAIQTKEKGIHCRYLLLLRKNTSRLTV